MTSFAHSAFGRILRWIADQVCRHPRRWIYPQLLLAILGILWAGHSLTLDMNRDDLVGAGKKYHEIYMEFQKEFPGEGDQLAVVVESGSLERNHQFIERLASRIRPQTNNFADLFYKTDLASLGRKGLLLIPTNDLAAMRQQLREYRPWIWEFSRATNLDSLFELVNRQFRAASVSDPSAGRALIGAIPFFQKIIVQARDSIVMPGTPTPPEIESLFGGAEAEEQLYITFNRGQFFLLTARPRTEALTATAIELLRGDLRQTQLEVPGVDVGLTGGPVLDYDEMRQSEHDTIVASIVALALCSAIFITAYRAVFRPLKTAFCLLIGLGYSIAFTTLAIGHLNILTITFAPMLIGLAIDFGIHFITRFEEERRNGRSGPDSIRPAMVFTGQGIVTGAFTTAAAFLAMALTHFKGIQEMGIISGVGLLLCLVPMMTALPALLLKGPENRRDRPIAGRRRLHVENFWLQHSLSIVAVIILLCAGAALEIPNVRFDYNLLDMQSQQLPSVIYEKKLIHLGERSSLYGAVIANTLPQARSFEQALKTLPAVSSIDSAADFFTNQQPRLALARSIQRELEGLHFAPVDRRPVQVESLSATLWYLTGYLGLASAAARREDPVVARQLDGLRDSIMRFRIALLGGAFPAAERLSKYQQAFFAGLHRTFQAIQDQDTRGPLRPRDLPPPLRDRFIGRTGQYLLQVYPKQNLWDHENQREFIEQLESVVPADQVTGTPVQLYEYTTLLKDSYVQAAYYALGAIAIMVLLHFRSWLSVALAILPFGIGALWLIGFLGLAGIEFNPANIMTLPLVVGIGVTNGIQILNRFAEERRASILARSTGKAVFVSGLTAIAGFGSLILAHHQGIRSLGIVMSIGIAACMASALGFLPALLNLLVRRGWKIMAWSERAQAA